MGRINAALYYRLIAVLLLVATTVTADPVTGTIKGVKFPEYDNAGKLEYMLYSKIANPRGVIIDMQGVLVDFVQSGISVNQINDNRHVKLYSIDQAAALDKEIPAFWLKYPYSKAFCRTPKAKYDRASKLIQGDEKVRFRTEQMDIDGIGFDMDQKAGKLHIRSNVHVVLRDANDEKNSKGNIKNEK